MTLIEGIGDEVTHFFIALFVITVVSLAWWTTNISEQRHVRTVVLLERRRHRHRRLTNHTETVTITEGTLLTSTANVRTPIEDDTPSEASASAPDSSEAPGSEGAASKVDTDNNGEPEVSEEQNIIETMDADTCELRQRRLAFYDNFNNERQGNGRPVPSAPPATSQASAGLQTDTENITDDTLMEHNYAERPSTTSASTSNVKNSQEAGDDSKNGITIKLKYLNDDLKLVDGRLEENLGDFKRRHFQPELSANQLIRLIFNGQVLQPDTQTLKNCGLFDNCVVHCLVHQKRPQSNDASTSDPRREGFSFPTTGNGSNNNDNQNRDWDLGNFLFAFISFILLAAWYFRYVYAHLYTVTATVGLFLITGIFSIVIVGMYFPDNDHLPNPTIHIARERAQPQQ
ncbi:hypothetical protein NQ317_002699 [Molorchus minor]|uniref:Ubiquitin-like domain-containing protein n=1 Tax=Molorchus minor TaxID=1323400 RepID=A0ABQ9K5P8_9CUCU|nr:hypothetical protein NQ317_002699 [Molorchus minor]